MTAPLSQFFAEMESFLLGHTTTAELESALGPSPSGSRDLTFYRTLIDRNFLKTMRLLFPIVKVMAERTREGLWRELVAAYAVAHPPRGCRDPNQMGIAFSEFLSRRRERTGEFSTLLEELAEYHWIDYLARTASDVDDDGMEKRLFIRQFTIVMPEFMRAINADAEAPEPEAKPSIVLLYRSLVDGAVQILYPRPATMAVIAKRQGLPLPPPLAQLDPNDVALTEASLVKMGVLTPSTESA